MEPRISFVTLGVRDLERMTRFYRDVLKLPQKDTPPEVSFFEMGATWLALWSRELLAEDAGVPDQDLSGYRGFSLAHNVRSPEAVDALLAEVEAGGGKILRSGHPTEWGGYTGYFADPEGFLWEVAWNPQFPHV